MTDWPESVQEWDDYPPDDTQRYAIADAAIRDLKAMVEARSLVDPSDWWLCRKDHKEVRFEGEGCPVCDARRAGEQAEAAHAACSEKLRVSNAICIAEKRRTEQAEAERDALYEQVKMYGAANGELKDRLDGAEAEARKLREIVDAARRGSCDMSDGCPPNHGGLYPDSKFCEGCTLGPALARYDAEHGGGDD